MKKNKTLILLINIFLVSAIIAPVSGEKITYTINNDKILYVGGFGPNNFTKIQDAINNATNGDTIFVYDDSSPYYENIIVDKQISIFGENKNTTIIDGENNSYVIFISSIVGNKVFSNFTIQNGERGIVLLGPENFSVLNNIITHNKLGIEIRYAERSIITNNYIAYNTGGMNIENSNNNTISFNKIENNRNNDSTFRDAISVSNSQNNTISNNIVSHNEGTGISFHYSNNLVQGNTISYNPTGINLLHCSGGGQILGNNISNNEHGIYLWNSTYIDLGSNTFIHNDAAIYIWGDVHNLNITDNHIMGDYTEGNAGIVIGDSSENTIIRNTITKYDCGIFLFNGATLTTIINNDIKENKEGLYLFVSYNNKFIQNNFVGNTKTDTTFDNSLFAFRNHWDGNYWGKAAVLPKLIWGKIWFLNFKFPWVNIDRHPAREPISFSLNMQNGF